MHSIELAGKTALITGASSGIGRQIAVDLAREGVFVLLVARREALLKEVQTEIAEAGGKANYFTLDLTETQARRELLEDFMRAGIHIDILVNNAGFGWYGYYSEMPPDILNAMVSLNIEAMLSLTRMLLPGMQSRGYGHILNIGSIAGGFPNQGIAVYSATKAFLDAFTTALHREMNGSGVHVSVLRLGPVKTPFFDTAKALHNGYRVPGQIFSISVQKAASKAISLLKKPRRVRYVPGVFRATRTIELWLGPIIDRLGPLLLKRLPEKEGR